ncbi:hypothetical protein RRG48_04685 [Mycoplasmopsis canis]|uniref:hypothetical protein n=1 Tax=Mycoplasmopsis cynos TaxID=171284 RepID=UPI002AFE6441|nr:hypothetical protein [Mycoplasmopsis cynos]WQQ13400.1 hypothetical protein RRG58_01480 [Mycoplasmopsis cynos]WQQ13675.1 hypothetical protein RRG52_02890 [Mycoplasmopsis cynos]
MRSWQFIFECFGTWYKSSTIGINSNAFKDFLSFLLASTVQYNKHQTIILFSKSCATKEIKHLIDVFQEQKINFFLITANK